MRAPVYFPGVRAYFVITTVTAALLALVLLRPDRSSGEAAVLLELVAPLPLVVVSAGLLQGDASLALIAASRTRLSSLLVARWALALSGALMVPAAVHLVAAFKNVDGSLAALTWLAPTAFLSALSVLAAAITASGAAGIAVGLGYWAVSVSLTPALQDACSNVLPAVCTLAVWSSAYGLIVAGGAGWEANRAVLLLAAAVFLLITGVLYRNPERQVRATVQEATS